MLIHKDTKGQDTELSNTDITRSYNIQIVKLRISTANGLHWSNINSQQTPHVPPLRVSHGMSTMSNMGKSTPFYRNLTAIHARTACIWLNTRRHVNMLRTEKFQVKNNHSGEWCHPVD